MDVSEYDDILQRFWNINGLLEEYGAFKKALTILAAESRKEEIRLQTPSVHGWSPSPLAGIIPTPGKNLPNDSGQQENSVAGEIPPPCSISGLPSINGGSIKGSDHWLIHWYRVRRAQIRIDLRREIEDYEKAYPRTDHRWMPVLRYGDWNGIESKETDLTRGGMQDTVAISDLTWRLSCISVPHHGNLPIPGHDGWLDEWKDHTTPPSLMLLMGDDSLESTECLDIQRRFLVINRLYADFQSLEESIMRILKLVSQLRITYSVIPQTYAWTASPFADCPILMDFGIRPTREPEDESTSW